MELSLPEPRDASAALRFCKCAEKAATMKAEGYYIESLEPYGTSDAVMVHKPLNEDGIYVGGYAIDLRLKTCNCDYFKRHGSFCKHLLFAVEELQQEERARWEAICAQVGDAEDAEHGVDPHFDVDRRYVIS